MATEGAAESEKSGPVHECDALVDKLCAKSAPIKAAVVSADMFIAMAKPATASAALKLVEEKGLELSDEIVSRVSTGQAERMEQMPLNSDQIGSTRSPIYSLKVLIFSLVNGRDSASMSCKILIQPTCLAITWSLTRADQLR